MTLKEMFKKIDSYNEIANEMGTETVELEITFGRICLDTKRFDSYKSLKKWMKSEYINEFVDAVLGYDGYSFNSDARIEYRMMGFSHCLPDTDTVGTYIYRA